MCPCQECGLLTAEELCAVAPAGRGAAEVQRGAVARQVLSIVAQQMETLGLKPRGSLVWLVHCGKTRVSDQQLAAWSKIGGAIAPEKVRLRRGHPASTCTDLRPASLHPLPRPVPLAAPDRLSAKELSPTLCSALCH